MTFGALESALKSTAIDDSAQRFPLFPQLIRTPGTMEG